MIARRVWQTIAQHAAAGRALWITAVVAHTRGSPGTTGAVLWVADHGEHGGTIGGGGMEQRLIADGRAALHAPDSPPRYSREIHRADAGPAASGLICAGEQTHVAFRINTPAETAAIVDFARAQASDTDGALVVTANGLAFAPGASAPTGVQVQDAAQAGWRVVISARAHRRLVIFGAGHCGQCLARLAAEIGYRVDLYDRRATLLDRGDWPAGLTTHQLADHGRPPLESVAAAGAFAVAMSDNVGADIAALAGVAKLPWAWIGVMGSRHKIHVIKTRLAEAGLDAITIEGIAGPIGLPMKSNTPAEIAVSVMGQLLRLEQQQSDESCGGAAGRPR